MVHTSCEQLFNSGRPTRSQHPNDFSILTTFLPFTPLINAFPNMLWNKETHYHLRNWHTPSTKQVNLLSLLELCSTRSTMATEVLWNGKEWAMEKIITFSLKLYYHRSPLSSSRKCSYYKAVSVTRKNISNQECISIWGTQDSSSEAVLRKWKQIWIWINQRQGLTSMKFRFWNAEVSCTFYEIHAS